MWRRTSYVVTVFDRDSGKVYKHHHDSRKGADAEVVDARQWGFVAWMVPTRRELLSEGATREATM
jgi:hypothetical protein